MDQDWSLEGGQALLVFLIYSVEKWTNGVAWFPRPTKRDNLHNRNSVNGRLEFIVSRPEASRHPTRPEESLVLQHGTIVHIEGSLATSLAARCCSLCSRLNIPFLISGTNILHWTWELWSHFLQIPHTSSTIEEGFRVHQYLLGDPTMLLLFIAITMTSCF